MPETAIPEPDASCLIPRSDVPGMFYVLFLFPSIADISPSGRSHLLHSAANALPCPSGGLPAARSACHGQGSETSAPRKSANPRRRRPSPRSPSAPRLSPRPPARSSASVGVTFGRALFQMAVLQREDAVHVAGQLQVVGGDQGGDALVCGQSRRGCRTPPGWWPGRGCRWARRPAAGAAGWPARGRRRPAAARRPTAGPAGASAARPGPGRSAAPRPAPARRPCDTPAIVMRQGHVVAARRTRAAGGGTGRRSRSWPAGRACAPAPARSPTVLDRRSMILAVGGLLQQAGGVQQRRLARARRPDQPDDLARQHVQVDAVQHRQPTRPR